MRLLRLAAFLSILLAGPQGAEAKIERDTTNLVAIGRLEQVSREPIDDPNDMLGHSFYVGRLHISRVIRGKSSQRVITARYYSHNPYPDDIDLRLKLQRGDNGDYVICKPPGGDGIRCD